MPALAIWASSLDFTPDTPTALDLFAFYDNEGTHHKGVQWQTLLAQIIGSLNPAIINTAVWVTAGSYTYGSFTVDAAGRLTAASSGTAPVTSVTGTAPIVSSGGTTPAISINAATTSAAGSMSSADKIKLDAITGSNTGDQIITLTGEVTGSGSGSASGAIAVNAYGIIGVDAAASAAASHMIGQGLRP